MASSRANRTPKKRVRFLEVLATTGNVTLAAAAANTPRRTVYEWRDADEAFAAAWDSAMDEAADLLEAEARRRAHDGVDEPQFGRVGKDKDGQIGVVRKYSDTLLIFLLKGAKPEKYRETSRTLHINVTPEELAKKSDAELDELERQLTGAHSPRTRAA